MGPTFPSRACLRACSFIDQHLRVSLEGGAFEDVPAESLECQCHRASTRTRCSSPGSTAVTRHAVTIAGRAGAASVARQRAGEHRETTRARACHGALASAQVECRASACWRVWRCWCWSAGGRARPSRRGSPIRVSMETEISIGERALAQLETRSTCSRRKAWPPQTVADIGARLTAGFALPVPLVRQRRTRGQCLRAAGGIVVVNAGMIEAAGSAEELAGVLAHEVQHVEHRHTLQQMIHTAGWAAVLAVVLGDVSAMTAIVIHQLGNLRNSRKLEAQADVEGMKALARAGIPLGGLAVAVPASSRMSSAASAAKALRCCCSHPATEERIADLEQLAAHAPVRLPAARNRLAGGAGRDQRMEGGDNENHHRWLPVQEGSLPDHGGADRHAAVLVPGVPVPRRRAMPRSTWCFPSNAITIEGAAARLSQRRRQRQCHASALLPELRHAPVQRGGIAAASHHRAQRRAG